MRSPSHRLLTSAAMVLMAGHLGIRSSSGAELKAETLRAWDHYVQLTEQRLQEELTSAGGPQTFLSLDSLPEGRRLASIRRLKLGEVLVEAEETKTVDGQRVQIPSGLAHHWRGTVFVPDTDLETVLVWVQDYSDRDRHFEEVVDSDLIRRDGDVFQIFLRLRRKKILTVYYDTEHRVHYQRLSPMTASSSSVATHIAELDHVDTPRERKKTDDEAGGFLWRLRSYWRFVQRGGGVWIECETISLSRNIPRGMSWMLRRFVESVPKESMHHALAPIRETLAPKPSPN